MADRSSRPHRQPTRTPAPVVRKIVHLRWKQRLGPVADRRPAGDAGLDRARGAGPVPAEPALPHRPAHRGTDPPLRTRRSPGALLHVDVKKLGNIPDGGGWRYVGRPRANATEPRPPPHRQARNQHYNPMIGTAFVHTVIDDHSRVAYAEIHDDETAATAVAVLRRAVAWFAARGVTIERVLSDNGGATSPTPGATPAPNSASPRRRPAPTGPRPTARSNASTAPSPTAGPSGSSTPPNQPAAHALPAGCTTTTTTGPTPPSARPHPSPA